MTYDTIEDGEVTTIEDGELTPLQEGGCSDDAPSKRNQYTASAIVRAMRAMMMVSTAVTVLLWMMAGHTKMLLHSSRHVDGFMVIVSSTARYPNNGRAPRNEAEKERIAKAEIVYIVAPSGAGKTFTGDALAYLHGYTHVDGDYPWRHAAVSARNQELTCGLVRSIKTVLDENEDGPDDLWTPYYEEIATLTLQAATTSSKVVLSQTSLRQAYREYVVKKLIEGGAKRENIQVLELRIDPDVKLTGLYYRTKDHIEYAGKTITDEFKRKGWDGEGPFTVDEYKIFIKKKYPKYAGNDAMEDIPDRYGTIIDVSSRDMTCIDRIENALGLDARDRNVQYQKFASYDEFRDKIEEFDQARDEEFHDNGSQVLYHKMWSDVNGKGFSINATKVCF